MRSRVPLKFVFVAGAISLSGLGVHAWAQNKSPTSPPVVQEQVNKQAQYHLGRGFEEYFEAETLIQTRQATSGAGKKLSAAIEHFTKAIAADPNFAKAYLWRGRAIALAGFNNAPELRRAIADLDKAIELAPDAESYFERAKVKASLLRRDKNVTAELVLSDLDEALRRDGRNFHMLNARAKMHEQMGRLDLALADIERSERLFMLQPGLAEYKKRIQAKMAESAGAPGNPVTEAPHLDMDAYLAKLKRQMDASETKEAMATATECIAAYPTSVPCHTQRAQLHFKAYMAKALDVGKLKLAGKQDQQPEWLAAVADQTKAITMAPQNAELYYQRGLIYLQGYNAEPFELAMADAKMVAKLNPAHPGAKSLLERGIDGFASSLAREADQKWARAAGLRADNKNVEAEKELNEAVAMMTRVLAIAPSYSLSLNHQRRARMYRDLKKPDLAIADYSKAIELNVNCGDCYIERAEAYRTQKKYELAFADYDKLLTRPDDVFTKYQKRTVPHARADTYREMGKFDWAIAEYSKVLAVDPKHQNAQWGIALAYLAKGDKKSAVTEFKKTLAISWDTKALREEIAKLGVVLDEAASTGSPVAAGQWKTTEGAMTLNQNDRTVSGSYSNDGGEIVGEMKGNVLDGYWIEDSAEERCATARNGRFYWGRIRWTFDGGRFSGAWSYCDKAPPTSGNPWSGERLGTVQSAQPPKPSVSPVSNGVPPVATNPNPVKPVSTDALLGQWEGTMTNSGTKVKSNFRFYRDQGRLVADWVSGPDSKELRIETVIVLERMISIKGTGGEGSVSFTGRFDPDGNGVSGTFSMNVEKDQFAGSWEARKKESSVAAPKTANCTAGASPRWAVATPGSMPTDAIPGGQENDSPLLVCRGAYNGGMHPGKVIGKQCNIGWGVNEVGLVGFEVLRGNAATVGWVAAQNGTVPANAVEGGTENGHPLPICRIPHNGGVHPGKLVAGHCHIGWGGKSVAQQQYEVMVANSSCSSSSAESARHTQISADLATERTVAPSVSSSPSTDTLSKVLFYDDFVDNRSSWNIEHAGDHTYAITPAGQLVMEGRANYGYTVQLRHASAPKIDQSKDFSIETTFRQLTGDPAHPIGILWGRKDGTSSFYFGIFASGRYNYGRNKPSGWFELVNGTTDAINKGLDVKNKIAIRKRGAALEFYVNDKFVSSTPYLIYTEPLPTIGVTFNLPKRVVFDYIKVMQ